LPSVVAGSAEQSSGDNLPKVVLLGDSIRLGYAPFVIDQLEGEAQVISDLHWLVEQQGTEAMMLNDGTHFTGEGYEKLAAAVADSVRRELKVRNYRPIPSPAKGPEAAADYRRNEAAGDALVPEVYRRMRPPELHFSTDPDTWQRQRPDVRKTVLDSLGDLPARPVPLKVRRICREIRTGYSLESVRVDNGVDSEISALLLVPDGLSRPARSTVG
jgi:hypothetical protein